MKINSINGYYSAEKKPAFNTAQKSTSISKQQNTINDMKQLYPLVSFGNYQAQKSEGCKPTNNTDINKIAPEGFILNKTRQTATLTDFSEVDYKTLYPDEVTIDFKSGTITTTGHAGRGKTLVAFMNGLSTEKQPLTMITPIPEEIMSQYSIDDFDKEKMVELLNTKPYTNSFFTLKDNPYTTEVFTRDENGQLVHAKSYHIDYYSPSSETLGIGIVSLDDSGKFKGLKFCESDYGRETNIKATLNQKGKIEESIDTKRKSNAYYAGYEKYKNTIDSETGYGSPVSSESSGRNDLILSYRTPSGEYLDTVKRTHTMEYYPSGQPKIERRIIPNNKEGKKLVDREIHYNENGIPVYIKCNPNMANDNALILSAAEMIRNNPDSHFSKTSYGYVEMGEKLDQ